MTTRIKFMEGSSEVTKFIFPDGRQEIHTTDYQGRQYISRFGSNGSFQGTSWANREVFRSSNSHDWFTHG